MVVYAKSKPPETLAEHTQQLIDRLPTLKHLYGEVILARVPSPYRSVFWDALDLVIKCHDLGKIHTPFQNMIRKALKLPLLPDNGVPALPHNLLSPAFIWPLVETFPQDVRRAIYQAIAFHHFHGVEFDYVQYTGWWKQIFEVVEKDLALVWCERLADMVRIPALDRLGEPKRSYKHYLQPVIDLRDGELYCFYVMLKGLMHRLDHSASAHLPVEEDLLSEPESCVTNYLLAREGVTLESIWQTEPACRLSPKNVILTASTGIGKTEFALYWLNGQKGFYTLPVRTSVNAMYDRVIDTFKAEGRIGLLHSDAYFYCLEDYWRVGTLQANENEEGANQSLRQVDVARQLAMPLTVSTADQLFTAVFKYKGYEKIYATLAYAKVIIDEIQSYDPDLAAVILRGLVELAKLGGQFCIVTATLPPVYRDYLEQGVPNLEVLPPKYLAAKKHKVKIEPHAIDSGGAIEQISNLYHDHKKVLVIVNTVKKAQMLYGQLQQKFGRALPLSLLHSGFIYRDRRSKEVEILRSDVTGVWITTQLVEVSLNIDFPVLLTEIATIDALIQRMGRVLRFVESNFIYEGPPNIFIYENASGIGSIYDHEIVRRTVQVLREKQGASMSEEQKAEFIERIFSRSSLRGTKYLSNFRNSLSMLEGGYEAETRSEAQRLFRKISNLTAIPCGVYQSHMDEIDQSLEILETKSVPRLEKFRALATLRECSVSVPMFRAKRGTLTPLKKRDLFLLNMGYSPEYGLEPSVQIEDIL